MKCNLTNIKSCALVYQYFETFIPQLIFYDIVLNIFSQNQEMQVQFMLVVRMKIRVIFFRVNLC